MSPYSRDLFKDRLLRDSVESVERKIPSPGGIRTHNHNGATTVARNGTIDSIRLVKISARDDHFTILFVPRSCLHHSTEVALALLILPSRI